MIELFADRRLCDLNLRYFDPTQSDCSSRIDKGLVEALMLKRALCTVYMVQESDTLGKDSELASTLAQGKPVVAFVPAVDVVSHAEKITTYPLEYFRVRFRVLDAEGVFDDPDLRSELHKLDAKFAETLTEFLRRVDDFAGREPLTLCGGREANFKKKLAGFGLVCKILATAEQHNFERRAKILRNLHPLSLQVHLESGVANGVLVVRSVQECAEVVHGLLTNRLEFAIENDEDQNCTILREKVSKSPFRVVSNYEKLSNSFWNFYPFSG